MLSNISSRVGQKSKLKADVSEPEEPWISITPIFLPSQGSPNEPVPADYWDPAVNMGNGSVIASDSSSSSYGEPDTHYPRSSFNSPVSAYSPDERHTGSARESVNPNPYYLGISEQSKAPLPNFNRGNCSYASSKTRKIQFHSFIELLRLPDIRGL